MNFRPAKEEITDIAKTGKYDVVPVSCELFSDFITPIETVRILKNVSTHCFMLESAHADETWGRYTFLGLEPKMEITCLDGRLKAGDISIETNNPSSFLRKLLSKYRSPHFDYLPPFTGGLAGYFSYDYLAYSEPTVKRETEDSEAFKDVDLMLFDKLIAFDNVRQKLILIANMKLDDIDVNYNKAVMELKQLASLLKNGDKINEPAGRLTGDVTPLFDKEQFCAKIGRAHV